MVSVEVRECIRDEGVGGGWVRKGEAAHNLTLYDRTLITLSWRVIMG